MLALPPALAVAFASLALPLRILLWLLLALMMRNFFALALVVCLPPLLTFLLPFCVMAGRSPWLGPRSQAHKAVHAAGIRLRANVIYYPGKGVGIMTPVHWAFDKDHNAHRPSS